MLIFVGDEEKVVTCLTATKDPQLLAALGAGTSYSHCELGGDRRRELARPHSSVVGPSLDQAGGRGRKTSSQSPPRIVYTLACRRARTGKAPTPPNQPNHLI